MDDAKEGDGDEDEEEEGASRLDDGGGCVASVENRECDVGRSGMSSDKYSSSP